MSLPRNGDLPIGKFWPYPGFAKQQFAARSLDATRAKEVPDAYLRSRFVHIRVPYHGRGAQRPRSPLSATVSKASALSAKVSDDETATREHFSLPNCGIEVA